MKSDNIINKHIESFQMRLKEKEKQSEERKRKVSLENEFISKCFKKINLAGVALVTNQITENEFDLQIQLITEEIQEELVKIGKESDYFEVEYECEKCKDRGFVNSEMCDCLKLYINRRSQHKKEFKSTFDNFDISLFAEEIGRYSKSPRENMKLARMKILNFINNFDNDTIVLGFLLLGTGGTGKTFLAECAGNMLVEQGRSVEFLTSYEFEDVIKNFSDIDYKSNVQKMFECDLLILDDLGVENQTDYMNNNMLKLLDYRAKYKKKMIITTNLKLKEIQDMYKSRIYSRLIGNFNFINFYGKDIRVEKRLRSKE